MGGLFTAGGATFNFDLSSSISGNNDLVQVNGPLTLNGTNTVAVYRTNGALANGEYPLFDYTGALTYASSSTSLVLTAGALSLRQSSSFDYSQPNMVMLNVMGTPAGLTWTGTSATSAWNQNVTGNTVWTDTSGSANYFAYGDNVTFAAASSYNVVQLSGSLNPATLTVSGSNPYTFYGSGYITGLTSLVVTGSGALTLANPGNNYTGGTLVQSGTLALGTNNALPIAGALVLGGSSGNGTFDMAGLSQQVGGLAAGSGAAAANQVIGNSAPSTVSTLTFSGNGPSVFAGTIQDGFNGGGGQVALTVAAGLLNLSGSNTYTGPTTISGGMLQLGSPSALYAGAAVNNLADNGTLDLDGNNAGIAGLSGAGTVVNSGTAAALTLGNNNATSTFSGIFQGGTLSLAKTGTGTFVLTGTNNSLATAVNQGTFQVGSTATNGAFGSSAYNIAGGARLYLNYATAVAGGTAAWSNQITGSGTLELNSAQAVNGSANWGQNSAAATTFGPGFIGTLQVDNGRFDSSSAGLGRVSNIIINSNAQFLAWSGTYSVPITIAGNTWGETGQPGALRLAGANVATWNGGITLSANAGISAQSGATFSLNGPIIGNYRVEFETSTGNAGTLIVTPSGAVQNSYASTQIDTGATVVAGNQYALSTGPLFINGGALKLNGNNLSFADVSSSGTSANIQNGNASTPAAITVGSDNSNMTFGGTLTNGAAATLGLTKTGSGQLTLTAANTYTGTTTVSNGTLLLAGSAALGTGGLTANSGVVNLNGYSFTVAALAGAAGTVSNNGAANSTLTVNQAAATTFNGVLQDGPTNTVALIKGGSGSLTLAGTSGYSAGTTINGGNLQFNSTAALPVTGSILINPGGALNATGAYGNATAWLASGRIVNSSSGALGLVANSSEALDFTQSGGYPNLYLGSVGSNTFSGTIVPGPNGYLLGGAGGTLTLPNVNTLTGAGSLAIGGPGTVVLAAANNITGPTTISSGTLQLADPGAVANSTVTLAANNGLGFAVGISPVLGGLSGGGSQVLQDVAGNAITLTVGNNNANTTYSGVLSGSGGLTKTGGGTITLSGTSTFTGALTIGSGVVATNLVNTSGGAQGIGSGNSLVFNGGTFRYTGGNYGANFAPAITLGTSGGTIDTSGGYLFYGGALGGLGPTHRHQFFWRQPPIARHRQQPVLRGEHRHRQRRRQ